MVVIAVKMNPVWWYSIFRQLLYQDDDNKNDKNSDNYIGENDKEKQKGIIFTFYI